jgi:hypothetical protein
MLVAYAAEALAATSGCVRIDGGAFEIGWVVRNDSGRSVCCDDADIATVRVRLEPTAEEGADVPTHTEDFACDDREGSTNFEIAQARYLFSIEPLTQSGEILGTDIGIEVPPVREREIRTGEITDLEVWLIRASGAPTGCD